MRRVRATKLLKWKSYKYYIFWVCACTLNPLTPNDLYMSRTAPLTSKRCILYIYPTNVGTEYFKHALYSQFFSLQNAVCFIMLTSLVPVLFTFYTQGVLKLKKNNSRAKGLSIHHTICMRHIVICGPSGSTIFFPRYLINSAIFEKTLLDIKYVFWFSLHICLNNFSL